MKTQVQNKLSNLYHTRPHHYKAECIHSAHIHEDFEGIVSNLEWNHATSQYIKEVFLLTSQAAGITES